MKRLLIGFIIVAVVFNIASARKKKNKAGTIKDGVYTDLKYDFSISTPEEWKTTVKKAEKNLRLVMSKKQYDIPIDYIDYPTYTKVPKITVFVDTSSMPLDWFVDSILSDKCKSKQKKAVLEECEILYGDFLQGEFLQKNRLKMTIGGINGVLVVGERKYTIEIPEPVTNFYGGAIFFAKNDNNIYIFNIICELLYFTDIYKEYISILNSLKFKDAKEEKAKG